MRPLVSANRPDVSRPGQLPGPAPGPTPVRFAAVAIGLSLATHGVLMAVLGAIEPDPPPPRRPAPRVALASPPLTITPIDLALVGPPATAIATAPPTTPPPPASRPAPPPRGSARPLDASGDPPSLTTGASATGEIGRAGEPGASTGGAPGAGGERPGGWLDMRPPPAIDLSPRAVTSRVDVAGGAPPPPPPVISGELDPSGGGTFRSRQPGFTAKVDRDGEVTFEDAAAFDINFPILDVLRHPVGTVEGAARGMARSVEEWQRDPWKQVREADRYPGRNDSAPADGTITRHTGDKPDSGGTVPIAGGTAELTDWVMRQGGQDPYAAAKRQWLDRTRDERLAIKAASEERKLAETTRTVRTHARRVWAQTGLDAATRRAALFELWDDAAEDGSPALIEAGAAARSAVLGFIRANLPAGSAEAFTAAEIAAFNARRLSRQEFAPY